VVQRVLAHLGRGRTASSLMDDVLLDVDVEDKSSPCHPVRLVSGAQGREPQWCAGSDQVGVYDVHRTWASTIRSI
jgi:hypothetical protein